MSGKQLELWDGWEQTLSPREIEVLVRVSNGATNNEIAKEMFISPETVKTHIRHALAKTGTKSRAHAVSVSLRKGLIV